MALKKTIQLPTGISGEYIRVGAYRWDRLTREASAELMLYSTQAFAATAAAQPICLIGKLRLTGAKFDEYLANAVLDGASMTVIGQLYKAAKAAPNAAQGHVFISGGGLPNLAAGLPAVDLSDAQDI